MEFKILGPFEVSNEHGAVALGGVKPRAVLAVLLLNANEPVSAERLAQALWGDDVPAGAVKAVQVHVSRLRKALGNGDVVETTRAGYRLHVRPGELDAELFEHLVEDGRQALAAGHPEQAAAVLREALTLWRGSPLAELAFEPFAQAEIARLDEQRLAAVEARVEADLAAGREAELIGELQQLAAVHPTRERLAGQLMLALYRCGRQAEALEAYGEARRVLVAEIGVEPGPELRRLHEAILRQDASLEPELVIADLPRELDAAAAPPLEGRLAELAWLHERWEQARAGAGVLVTVHGEQGIGKSRLSAELAGDAHAVGGAVVYAAGTGPTDAVLGVLVRAREATRPTLVVIDDADRAGDDVRASLVATPRAVADVPVLVLVLSGDGDAGALARLPPDGSLLLQPLDVESVHAIAVRYAPGHLGQDVPAEWLLDASGGVPLRVHQLASEWARREGALRVGAVAEQAAVGRAELRSMEDELADGVVDLQVAGEHLALITDDDAPVVCPFKGLASFDVADAPYFFGREQLVAELVARSVGAPLLGVVGPSGSGKSSVVRAGLLPALASGVLPDSGRWTQVLVRPGEHPMRELRDAVTDLPQDRRMLIAVDQFEETFSTCRDEEERTAFIAALARAARDPHEQAVVVIAVRADYYGRCAAYPELSSLLAANHVLVRPMQSDELRRAIELPAHRAGLRVDPELTDALVADTEAEPGALPLLSTALLELWQRRHGRRLRHADYERMGGVRAAVARLAEGAFERLDDAQKTVARGVFMRLAGEGGDIAVERRRVPLAEVQTSDEDAAGVVALLTDQRLLTISAGSVEIAHEALLREWPRLRDWIEEDREGQRIHRRVTVAAEEWGRLHQDEDALYRGTHLTEALEWRASRHPALNQLEREFLDASDARRRRVRATRRRRIEFAFAALLLSLAVITVVAGVALHQRREATQQRDIAVSRQLAATATNALQSDPATGLTLALRALDAAHTDEAEVALRQATLQMQTLAILRGHRGRVTRASFAADGRRAVSAGTDGTVRIWDLGGTRAVRTIPGHNGTVYQAVFSPDGRRLASTGEDGTVAVMDAQGRGRRIVVRVKDAGIRDVDFSPDGQRIAAGAEDGNIYLARADGSGQPRVLKGHDSPVRTLDFAPDGRSIVSGDLGGPNGSRIRVWDVASGRSRAFPGSDTGVSSVSFRQDGRSIVSTGFDDTHIRIRNADSGADIADITDPNGAIAAAAASPDGRTIVAGGPNGTVGVFDVATKAEIGALRGHRGDVTDVGFSPTGNRMISAGDDGTVRIWRRPSVRIFPAIDFVYGAALSSDAKRIMTWGDGGIAILNASDGKVAARVSTSPTTAAAISPDGRQVIGGGSNLLRVWTVAGGPARINLPAPTQQINGAAFSPDGRRAVTAGEDGRLIVWSIADHRAIAVNRLAGRVSAAAFSPDGQRVVSASEDGVPRIWRADRAARPLVSLKGNGQELNAAAFSFDGRRVATGAADGTVRVQSARGSDAGLVLRAHVGQVLWVAFSRDGTKLATAGADGTVRIWDARTGGPLAVLALHPGTAVLSVDFTPGGRDVMSALADDTIRVTRCEVCGSLDETVALARARRVG